MEKKPPLSQKGVREARRGRAGSRRGAREKTKSRRTLELRGARWSDCVGGEYSAVHCTALHCPTSLIMKTVGEMSHLMNGESLYYMCSVVQYCKLQCSAVQ